MAKSNLTVLRSFSRSRFCDYSEVVTGRCLTALRLFRAPRVHMHMVRERSANLGGPPARANLFTRDRLLRGGCTKASEV